MIYDALIIGGGASGLMAACALGRFGLKAAVLEKQPRVGRKLLSTGNGRCNLTNMRVEPEDYHGSEALIRSVAARPVREVLAVFHELGVLTRVEAAQRVYPLSGQAAAVLDALRLGAADLGAELLCDFHVKRLEHRGDRFLALAADGRRAEGRCAIVATGGLAAPKLGGCGDGYAMLKSFGHRITLLRPVLTPLKTPPEAVRGLKGLRVQGRFALEISGEIVHAETGELLFTDYGVSGVAVMQLSRHIGGALDAGKDVAVVLDLLPDALDAFEEVQALYCSRRKQPLEELLTGVVPKRVGQVLLKNAVVGPLTRPAGTPKDAEVRAVAAQLTGWRLPIVDVQGYDMAQVTQGGADGRDFDPETLGSRLVPGLYAVGEVLDVDGACGGFNLHWAWVSALACAEAIWQGRHTNVKRRA